jgi:SAM-dependent methyltransferase
MLQLRESEQAIMRDAQEFWTRKTRIDNAEWWHIRDNKILSDKQWLSIGIGHVEMYRKWMRMYGSEQPLDRVVDWGCGGGANAVAFAPLCKEIYLVDPSTDAINETIRQLQQKSIQTKTTPIQLQIADPLGASRSIPGGIDLFLCLYVFEVFPSRAYANQIMRIAFDLLRKGGFAFIQFKYQTKDWRTRGRAWSYHRNVTKMVSYRVEEFWDEACEIGFVPEAIQLVPKSNEVPDFHYAYYLLRKPA